MKIALNLESVGARRGGAEKYAATLARLLDAAGHEVHVFARAVDAAELPAAVRVHRLPSGASPDWPGCARTSSPGLPSGPCGKSRPS